jgi:predicted PurR-regulated permease PerM
MKDLKTTNTLLLFIVVPLFFYLLKTLSFIFIPLTFSMFIALLFLPILRWLNKKNIPKFLSIASVIILVIVGLKIGSEVVKLSIKEIISADAQFFELAKNKIVDVIVSIEDFFGIERLKGDNVLLHYFQQDNFMQNFGSTLDYIRNTVTMTLMTTFFVILLLTESINFQKVLNSTLFKQNFSSVKIFMKIEKDILRFVKVKFVISLLTGVGFTLACLFFDIKFPIFWGLFAFLINFVQMVGSIVSVVLLSLFALVEIDPSTTLLLFVITITAVQVIMGGILEPIFMGKTFSLNVITVLIMLMLWGYIWGIAGLILAIPLTVLIKIILEQFPNTAVIAQFMSGTDASVKINWPKKITKI